MRVFELRQMLSGWNRVHSIACNFVIQGLTIVQAIVVARFLGAEGRGELGLLQIVPPVLSVVATLGTTQGLIAFSSGGADRSFHGPTALRFVLGFTLGVSVLLSGICGAVIFIADWPSPRLTILALLYIGTIPLEVLYSVVREYQIAAGRLAVYDISRVVQAFALCVMVVGSMFIWTSSVATVVWATVGFNVASALIAVLVVAASNRRTLQQRHTRGDRVQFLKFSVLCMAANLATIIQTKALCYLVSMLLTVRDLGLFMVATSWGQLSAPIWQGLQVSLYKKISSSSGAEVRNELATTLRLGIALSAIATIGGGFITPLIFPHVVGQSYHGGAKYAAAGLAVVSLQSLASLLQFMMRGIRRGRQVVRNEYLGLAVTLVGALLIGWHFRSIFAVQLAAGLGAIVIIASVIVSINRSQSCVA